MNQLSCSCAGGLPQADEAAEAQSAAGAHNVAEGSSAGAQ